MSSTLKNSVASSATRVNVISESFCDDILHFLAPSLRPFVGGTIIDYLPGNGVFTRKLHEHLKPRRHVLVEPQWKQYSQYLNPLLEPPDSKYILPKEHLTKHYPLYLYWYIDDGVIPKELEDNNATLQIVNATSPLVKTLARQPRPIDSIANCFFTQSRSRSHFHSRGPTRLLAWCDDASKFGILPRSVDQRRRGAVCLESFCKVDEVAGFGHGEADTQREQSITDASNQLVRQRMKDANLSIPSHRRADEAEQASDKLALRTWHRELFELEAAFKAGKIEKYGPVDDSKPKKRGRRKPSESFARMNYLRNILLRDNKSFQTVKPLIEEQAKIDALYLESSSPEISESDRVRLRKEIEQRHDTLVERAENVTPNRQKQFRFISDDTFAFHRPPGPLLQWDKRNYTPMMASVDDFAPRRKIALLDFQSQPQHQLPLTEPQELYFDLIARALFAPQGHHNLRLLDTVAPGAYDALVPKVPEFTDALEGGRQHADWLACRTLSPKMIWRLAVEWDKWLFKPDDEELIRGYLPDDRQLGMKKQRFTREVPLSDEG